jgi:hypothetical protein
MSGGFQAGSRHSPTAIVKSYLLTQSPLHLSRVPYLPWGGGGGGGAGGGGRPAAPPPPPPRPPPRTREKKSPSSLQEKMCDGSALDG